MQSNAARIGVLIAVVAAAIVLFLVLSDGDDEGDGTTTAITATTTGATTVAEAPESITVADGEPVGGVKRFTHQSGDRVSIEVTVDQSVEEVHVHGYEITEPAAGDVPIRLAFTADIDGLFEIEAHLADGTDEPIAELRVNP
jgi:hypothetical protein